VAVPSNGDEIGTTVQRDGDQLSGRIAVQHERQHGPRKPAVQALAPILERELGVSTETGGRTSPHDLSTPRRYVHEQHLGARRRETKRELRRSEARWAEIDSDDDGMRRDRAARRDRQHWRPCCTHQSKRRFVAEQTIAHLGTTDTHHEERIAVTCRDRRESGGRIASTKLDRGPHIVPEHSPKLPFHATAMCDAAVDIHLVGLRDIGRARREYAENSKRLVSGETTGREQGQVGLRAPVCCDEDVHRSIRDWPVNDDLRATILEHLAHDLDIDC